MRTRPAWPPAPDPQGQPAETKRKNIDLLERKLGESSWLEATRRELMLVKRSVFQVSLAADNATIRKRYIWSEEILDER
jgi:hypothetical protein